MKPFLEHTITQDQENLGNKLWERVRKRKLLKQDERDYLITLGALRKINALRRACV